jgi:hypothetical protein
MEQQLIILAVYFAETKRLAAETEQLEIRAELQVAGE